MSAIRYHVNPETNRPNQCKAKIRCDFAVDGQEPPHFETKEEARKHVEGKLTEEHGATQTVQKRKYKKSNINVNEAIAENLKAMSFGTPENIAKVRTSSNITAWRDLTALAKDIEKDKENADLRLKSVPHYKKAEKWIEQARNLGSKTPEELEEIGMSGTAEAYMVSRAGQAEREYNLAKRTGEYKSNANVYYGNINVLAKEIEDDKIRNEQEAGMLLNNAKQNEAVYDSLKKDLTDKTGYEEDPVYGIPSGETTLSKWKDKPARGYSQNPTKDVPVLKDAQSVCKNCGEVLVRVPHDSIKGAFNQQHESGKMTCNDGKTFISASGRCHYCGTTNPAHVEHKQMPYSDETHCSRCKGVSGYGIGD